MKNTLIIVGLSLLLIAPTCGGIKVCDDKVLCDCYTVVDGKLVNISCKPEPTPTPVPLPCSTPPPQDQMCEQITLTLPLVKNCGCYYSEDNDCTYKLKPPCSSPTPVPSPSITPEPSPSVTPDPEDCTQYNPYRQKWSLLTCTLNNKQTCGRPTDTVCGCNGENCKFTVKLGTVCNADSTPIYNGEVACWKTGTIIPCEYPPGSKCGATTDWTADSGVSLAAEPGGYGAKIKFQSKGSFKIKACRKGSKTLCTEKTANVN